jgi:hypothetical protein
VVSCDDGDIITYWTGESGSINNNTALEPDMLIQDYAEPDKAALVIKSDLQNRNIIYKI